MTEKTALAAKLMELDSGISEAMADFAAERAICEIKNYCRIEEVPDELFYTAVEMAQNAMTGVSEGMVSSVREGDSQVNYVYPEGKSSLYKKLDRFRKVGVL